MASLRRKFLLNWPYGHEHPKHMFKLIMAIIHKFFLLNWPYGQLWYILFTFSDTYTNHPEKFKTKFER